MAYSNTCLKAIHSIIKVYVLNVHIACSTAIQVQLSGKRQTLNVGLKDVNMNAPFPLALSLSIYILIPPLLLPQALSSSSSF